MIRFIKLMFFKQREEEKEKEKENTNIKKGVTYE